MTKDPSNSLNSDNADNSSDAQKVSALQIFAAPLKKFGNLFHRKPDQSPNATTAAQKEKPIFGDSVKEFFPASSWMYTLQLIIVVALAYYFSVSTIFFVSKHQFDKLGVGDDFPLSKERLSFECIGGKDKEDNFLPLPNQKDDKDVKIYAFRQHTDFNSCKRFTQDGNSTGQSTKSSSDASQEGEYEYTKTLIFCNKIKTKIGADIFNVLDNVQYIFARNYGESDQFCCLFAVNAATVKYHIKNDNKDKWKYGIFLELIVNESNPIWVYRNENDPNGYEYLYPCTESDPFLMPWYEYKGISKSSEIIQIAAWERVSLSVIPFANLELPTSTASLVSWIKNNWLAQTKFRLKYDNDGKGISVDGKNLSDKIVVKSAKLSQAQLDTVICPQLEKMLQDDFGGIGVIPPVLIIRIINGAIQFLTLFFFWIGMFLMLLMFSDRLTDYETLARIRRMRINLSTLKYASRNSDDNVVYIDLPNTQEEFSQLVKARPLSETIPILWSIFTCARYQNDYYADSGSYKRIMDSEEKKNENNSFLWKFFIGALGGLGFLGTVWGIGSALMNTSNVLSDELTKQQSGVSEVALALGTAFDTTMVSLSLSLVAGLVSTFFVYNEKRYLRCLDDYLSRELLQTAQPHAERQESASPSDSNAQEMKDDQTENQNAASYNRIDREDSTGDDSSDLQRQQEYDSDVSEDDVDSSSKGKTVKYYKLGVDTQPSGDYITNDSRGDELRSRWLRWILRVVLVLGILYLVVNMFRG